jgi:hypothetical protein
MKTLLKVVLWLAGMLTALVVLFYVNENIRGRYLWEQHLRELAAQGDSLDIRKYIPPPVPDDRNMAAAPIFVELFITNRHAKTRLGQVDPPYPKTPEGGDWRGGYVIIRKPGWTETDCDREIAERVKRGVRPTNSCPIVIFDA